MLTIPISLIPQWKLQDPVCTGYYEPVCATLFNMHS